VPVFISFLAEATRRRVAEVLAAWATSEVSSYPALANSVYAMAFLKTFKHSVPCPVFDADSLVARAPTSLSDLLRGKRPRTKRLIKDLRSACIKL
jgi:hypothetical protein